MEKCKIRRQNCTCKLLILANYHCLFNKERLFKLVLNWLWSNVFSRTEFKHLFLPVGYPQELSLFNYTDIACMKPTILVYHLGSKVGSFVVAHHDIDPFAEYFTIFSYFNFNSFDNRSACSKAYFIYPQWIDCYNRRCLGKPITLNDRNSCRPENLFESRLQSCST